MQWSAYGSFLVFAAVPILIAGVRRSLDGAGARTLITSVARRTDRPVRLDLDPDRRDIASWAQARGLPIVNETAFMMHGTPWPPGGAHDRLFCPLTIALG